jgi:hypothetical protein
MLRLYSATGRSLSSRRPYRNDEEWCWRWGGAMARNLPQANFVTSMGMRGGGRVWRISRKHCLHGAGALAREWGGGWVGIFASEGTAKIVTERRGGRQRRRASCSTRLRHDSLLYRKSSIKKSSRQYEGLRRPVKIYLIWINLVAEADIGEHCPPENFSLD